jgi:UDP-3-O-[3-hydroxymyristoyl] N-acetylglucosamine deacetylase
VSAEAVVATRLGTVIANNAGVTVSTIEHLMAALCALGVDNALSSWTGPRCRSWTARPSISSS